MVTALETGRFSVTVVNGVSHTDLDSDDLSDMPAVLKGGTYG